MGFGLLANRRVPRRREAMAIPGLLVEYLIGGALALVWINPLLIRLQINTSTPTSHIPLLALGLYFVGMGIDFCALLLFRPIKLRVRSKVEKEYGISDTLGVGRTASRNAKFLLNAPDVAKEVAMRSSRDRVARGAIINSALATIFTVPAWLGCLAIILSSAMWIYFEYSSYSFELKAEEALDKKLAIASSRSTAS